MKIYKIPHTDLVVSRIGYGCADLIGTTTWNRAPLTSEEVSKASEIIHSACDNGITLFDHANLYGFGKVEEAFGRILKQSPGIREQLVIQSKCGQLFSEDWKPGSPINIDLTENHIVSAVESSLRRLQTDRLDILLLHVPDPLVQPEEVAKAFDHLHRAGKVRYFGVSNHNASQIRTLKKSVQQPIVINQIRLSLGYPFLLAHGMDFAWALSKGRGGAPGRSPVDCDDTFDYCRVNDIQVQAYAPVRGDLLKLPEHAAPRFKQLAQLLSELAANQGTDQSAVALAWLLRHPARILPIIGTTNPQHIAQNCLADSVSLTNDEWYKLFAATNPFDPCSF